MSSAQSLMTEISEKQPLFAVGSAWKDSQGHWPVYNYTMAVLTNYIGWARQMLSCVETMYM